MSITFYSYNRELLVLFFKFSINTSFSVFIISYTFKHSLTHSLFRLKQSLQYPNHIPFFYLFWIERTTGILERISFQFCKFISTDTQFG